MSEKAENQKFATKIKLKQKETLRLVRFYLQNANIDLDLIVNYQKWNKKNGI